MHSQGDHGWQLEGQGSSRRRQCGRTDQAARLDLLRNHQVWQCAVFSEFLDPSHQEVRDVGYGPRARHAHPQGGLGDDLHRLEQSYSPYNQNKL